MKVNHYHAELARIYHPCAILYLFTCWVILHTFCSRLLFSYKLLISDSCFRNTIRVSNSLDQSYTTFHYAFLFFLLLVFFVVVVGGVFFFCFFFWRGDGDGGF